MADYDSSLPVRSKADGADERVQVKIVDFNTPSQGATVDTNKNLHTQPNGNNPAGAATTLKLSEQGSPNGDGFYNATNNSIPNSAGVIFATRGASPAATAEVNRNTGIVNGTVQAMDISLHDQNGAAYTPTNPMPVSMIEGGLGSAVQNYNTAAAVASGATSNHDYTVTAGKTLTLEQIMASASGRMKTQLQIETGVGTGVFTTVATFWSSTSNPNVLPPDFAVGWSVAAGVRVRLARTNEENATSQAFDVYSTIIGIEN